MCKIDDFVCVRVDFPFYNFPSCKDVSNFLQFDAGLRFNTFFVLFSRVKGVVDRVRSLIVIFKKFAYWRYSNWILHYQSQPREMSFFCFRDFDYGKVASLVEDDENSTKIYTHAQCWGIERVYFAKPVIKMGNFGNSICRVRRMKARVFAEKRVALRRHLSYVTHAHLSGFVPLRSFRIDGDGNSFSRGCEFLEFEPPTKLSFAKRQRVFCKKATSCWANLLWRFVENNHMEVCVTNVYEKAVCATCSSQAKVKAMLAEYSGVLPDFFYSPLAGKKSKLLNDIPVIELSKDQSSV